MPKIALYMRLSVEEQNGREESESITGQRGYLLDYLRTHDEFKGQEAEEYVDDGFSGTNVERPAFQRMMEDVKNGTVKTILVKDLSRFMRDYITIGDYMENIFPFMGVRFIAINDGYDSTKAEGNGTELDIQFKNLLYDFYTKDISEKLKSVQRMNRRQGKYNNWYPPFGYRKDPNDHYKVILDEETYPIVQDIFKMALDGLSTRQIAKILNERGTITLSERKAQLTKMNYHAQMLNGKSTIWMHGAVIKLLSNENYTGTYCFGFTKRKTVGGKGIPLPSEQWERIPNHHPAIVSVEDFQKVRELFRTKKHFAEAAKTAPRGLKSPLQGKLYCAECGHKLAYMSSKHDYGVKTYAYFCCRTCRMLGKKKPGLRVELAEKQVLEAIRQQVGVDAVQTQEAPAVNAPEVPAKTEEELLLEKDKAFDRYKRGRLSREAFLEQKQAIDEAIRKIKKELKQDDKIKDNLQTESLETLTKAMVERYVERITADNQGHLHITFKEEFL